MSGLARMLLDAGAIVSGSEPKPNQQTFELLRRGVKISRTQSGELLSRDLDLVVRTAEVPDNNGEFIVAWRDASFPGRSMPSYRVAGHGRTAYVAIAGDAWQINHHRHDGFWLDRMRGRSQLCRRRNGSATGRRKPVG